MSIRKVYVKHGDILDLCHISDTDGDRTASEFKWQLWQHSTIMKVDGFGALSFSDPAVELRAATFTGTTIGYYGIIKPNNEPTKREIAADAGRFLTELHRAKEIIRELLACKNNDCKCREGYGVCSQCRDVAERFLKGLTK